MQCLDIGAYGLIASLNFPERTQAKRREEREKSRADMREKYGTKDKKPEKKGWFG